MPSPKLVPTSIQVACLAACAPDSSDRGSARIRLPAAAWIAASVPYHSPVLVTIEDGARGSGQQGHMQGARQLMLS